MKRLMIIFTGISIVSTITYTLWTFLQPYPPQVDPLTVMNSLTSNKVTRYVALGDSYTIGEGLSPHENWPGQLVDVLTSRGVAISLVANPAHSGWTTQDLIDNELPVLEATSAQFVSIQIGTNDWVQGVSEETFRSNFKLILNRVEQHIPATKIVVVTLPDFSVTPSGKDYTNGKDASAGIKRFNEIIQEEAKAQGVVVVDIFELSKAMGKDTLLVHTDGLHPSAAEYKKWVDKIEPVVERILK